MSSSSLTLPSQTTSSVKFLNYAEFRATSLKQNFSIPESIVYYMTQNASSAEVYQKLIESCKYFFPKNPILVYHCLRFEENEWRTCVDESCLGVHEDRKYRRIDLDLDKIQSKIWVIFELRVSSSNSNLAASLIPKLYNGNVKCLTLSGQNISFIDFLFSSREVVKLLLSDCRVFYQDGAEVLYETIIANLPMIKCFFFSRPNTLYDFSNTVAELIKIPHFKKLKYFYGDKISELFDIDTFFKYLKENKTTWACLQFTGQLSDEYKEKLEAIVDEVLDAESPRAYIPPFIKFGGQLRIKQEALHNLCQTYL